MCISFYSFRPACSMESMWCLYRAMYAWTTIINIQYAATRACMYVSICSSCSLGSSISGSLPLSRTPIAFCLRLVHLSRCHTTHITSPTNRTLLAFVPSTSTNVQAFAKASTEKRCTTSLCKRFHFPLTQFRAVDFQWRQHETLKDRRAHTHTQTTALILVYVAFFFVQCCYWCCCYQKICTNILFVSPWQQRRRQRRVTYIAQFSMSHQEYACARCIDVQRTPNKCDCIKFPIWKTAHRDLLHDIWSAVVSFRAVVLFPRRRLNHVVANTHAMNDFHS